MFVVTSHDPVVTSVLNAAPLSIFCVQSSLPLSAALSSAPAQGLSATETAVLAGLGPVGRPARAACDELNAETSAGAEMMDTAAPDPTSWPPDYCKVNKHSVTGSQTNV